MSRNIFRLFKKRSIEETIKTDAIVGIVFSSIFPVLFGLFFVLARVLLSGILSTILSGIFFVGTVFALIVSIPNLTTDIRNFKMIKHEEFEIIPEVLYDSERTTQVKILTSRLDKRAHKTAQGIYTSNWAQKDFVWTGTLGQEIKNINSIVMTRKPCESELCVFLLCAHYDENTVKYTAFSQAEYDVGDQRHIKTYKDIL